MGEQVFVPFLLALQAAEPAPFTVTEGALQGPGLREPPSGRPQGQTGACRPGAGWSARGAAWLHTGCLPAKGPACFSVWMALTQWTPGSSETIPLPVNPAPRGCPPRRCLLYEAAKLGG